MCKRIFSVILSLGLVMVQSMNVNAAGNEGLSAEQLNTLLEGMDSIVLHLDGKQTIFTIIFRSEERRVGKEC